MLFVSAYERLVGAGTGTGSLQSLLKTETYRRTTPTQPKDLPCASKHLAFNKPSNINSRTSNKKYAFRSVSMTPLTYSQTTAGFTASFLK
jgi:hypothetical protein